MGIRATANRTRLAQTLGLASGTVRGYSQETSFPEPVEGADGPEYEVMAVIEWWILHKATIEVRRDLRDQLTESLGETLPEVWSAKAERELLELQLKDADVKRKLGELILVSDIKSELQRFAAKLGDALEAIQRTSGQPIEGIVEPVFEEFFQALQKKADPAS